MSIKLPIKHNIEIECEQCSETIYDTILIEDIEFESSDERGMGTETQYSFIQEIKCPYCGHQIEINGEVWEYPEGTVNLIQLL